LKIMLALDALLVLDAIDRRGSFAAAAAELHRVPSAITYAVRRLEGDLGVPLFDRRGHRARLTAAGRALLEDGRTLLRGADEIERRVRRIATGWEAELRIAIDTVIPAAAVWPLVALFDRECRGNGDAPTRVVLSTEVLGGTWEALADGRADLVIGANGDPPGGAGYRLRLSAGASRRRSRPRGSARRQGSGRGAPAQAHFGCLARGAPRQGASMVDRGNHPVGDRPATRRRRAGAAVGAGCHGHDSTPRIQAARAGARLKSAPQDAVPDTYS
jgi:DNA-binding transcriptional LysR family regulator